MFRIRLTRIGRKGQPKYRVVVAEHARQCKAKFLEVLGQYDPTTKTLAVKQDRVQHWLSVGAQPSQTVARHSEESGMQGMEKYIKHVTFTKKETASAE